MENENKTKQNKRTLKAFGIRISENWAIRFFLNIFLAHSHQFEPMSSHSSTLPIEFIYFMYFLEIDK